VRTWTCWIESWCNWRTNRDTLSSVFRTIHTIKGTRGFLGFTKLESVAHVGENLLSRLREGELALNPEITTGLLRMVDAIRQMLQSIEMAGNEGERNDEDLVRTLTKLQQAARGPEATDLEPLVQLPVSEVTAEQSTVVITMSHKAPANPPAVEDHPLVNELHHAQSETAPIEASEAASVQPGKSGGVS
jgi:two-component system chemotaxis sensor kinase CheA